MQWGPVLVGSRVSQFPVSLPVAGLSLAPSLVVLVPVVLKDACGLPLNGKTCLPTLEPALTFHEILTV